MKTFCILSSKIHSPGEWGLQKCLALSQSICQLCHIRWRAPFTLKLKMYYSWAQKLFFWHYELLPVFSLSLPLWVHVVFFSLSPFVSIWFSNAAMEVAMLGGLVAFALSFDLFALFRNLSDVYISQNVIYTCPMDDFFANVIHFLDTFVTDLIHFRAILFEIQYIFHFRCRFSFASFLPPFFTYARSLSLVFTSFGVSLFFSCQLKRENGNEHRLFTD